ncbi:hypothetical protein, partial [Lacticaseibacillus paracasei]|uniref:hypothetical protein n=1 Tax=Lacticaseibacillus paracasei TaxID=1597 RepID=UPI001CDCBE3E
NFTAEPIAAPPTRTIGHPPTEIERQLHTALLKLAINVSGLKPSPQQRRPCFKHVPNRQANRDA